MSDVQRPGSGGTGSGTADLPRSGEPGGDLSSTAGRGETTGEPTHPQPEDSHGGLGLEHRPRLTDIDPRAAKRAERQVLFMFLLSILGTLVVIASVFVFQLGGDDAITAAKNSTLALGLGLAVALFFIGAGTIHWTRKLMSGQEVVQERHVMRSAEEDRAGFVADLRRGIDDSSVPRRKALLGGLLAAIAPLLLAPIVLLRDLGPLPRQSLRSTKTLRDGVRIVTDVTSRPLRPADIPMGGLVSAVPESLEELSGTERLNELAKVALLLVRMSPEDIVSQQGEDWDYGGVLCYSKICTHVGCPLGLYEQTTHHMLCPCHQSTFDMSDSGRVVFGPAARNLPQLAISVDAEGYLVARGDFAEPPGPSFWERGQ